MTIWRSSSRWWCNNCQDYTMHDTTLPKTHNQGDILKETNEKQCQKCGAITSITSQSAKY